MTDEQYMQLAVKQAEIAKKFGDWPFGASRKDLSRLLRERHLGIDDLAKDSGYDIEIVRDVLKDRVIDMFGDISK